MNKLQKYVGVLSAIRVRITGLALFALLIALGGMDAMAQGSVPAEVQTVVDNVNATTALIFAAIGVAVAFVVGIRWARRIK
jgi:succinate dehydrogenase hydrophobic anchor subunit